MLRTRAERWDGFTKRADDLAELVALDDASLSADNAGSRRRNQASRRTST